MIEVRPYAGLGHAQHGWLDATHHFSFADYHDPARMGWGALRVWNDDTIAPQTGFPPHPHADMEIVTFVRTGAISHRDSLGNQGRTGAGDVQVMSAGTGIRHAEYNLEDEATTLFQIWILPNRAGGEPGWGQREFPRADRSGQWTVVASGDPEPLPGDSPDGRWSAVVDRRERDVLAVTLRPANSLPYHPWQEAESRFRKTVADWHKEDAQSAESREDWFAAAFHLAALGHLSEDAEIRERLEHACSQLEIRKLPRPANVRTPER